MEDMYYFSATNIEPEDLARCLQAAGHVAVISIHDIFGKVINVHHNVIYQGEEVQAYTRWHKRSGIEGFEQERQDDIIRKGLVPQSLFWIQYPYGAMAELASLLKGVLICYGGYINFEGHFLNQDTIKTLPDIPFGLASLDEDDEYLE